MSVDEAARDSLTRNVAEWIGRFAGNEDAGVRDREFVANLEDGTALFGHIQSLAAANIPASGAKIKPSAEVVNQSNENLIRHLMSEWLKPLSKIGDHLNAGRQDPARTRVVENYLHAVHLARRAIAYPMTLEAGEAARVQIEGTERGTTNQEFRDAIRRRREVGA